MSFVSLWKTYRWLTPENRDHLTHDISPQRTTHSLNLLSLPDELIVDVLAQLDCSFIFAARRTCQRLHRLSLSRHLWLRVISKLQFERGLVPPEEAVSRLSIRELENWALRRSTAYTRLHSRVEVQPRPRLLDLKKQITNRRISVATPYLLPGGRWLLLAHDFAGVSVYDLDSSMPAQRCLFNPVDFDESLSSSRVIYTFWFDYSMSYLSFYVAGNVCDLHGTRMVLYAVQLTGQGPEASLAASFVTALRSPGSRELHFGDYALNKNYYILLRGDRLSPDIVAYRLEGTARCKEYCLAKPVAQTSKIEGPTRDANFIYDDVLAIISSGNLMLFDIVVDGSLGSFKLLHVISLLGHTLLSNIRWTPMESYMTAISCDGAFQGLQIPHDKTKAPTVLSLGKHDVFANKDAEYAVDASATMSIDKSHRTLEMICHPWINVEGSPSLFKGPLDGLKLPYLRRRPGMVGFSEDIGRLVYFNDGSQSHIVVIDLTGPQYLHE